ncbi:hypothetical protein D6C93_08362 [Aureobasidium pullulans]|uniref:Uncharacterized protein n=1 Tax=Aureobasidium pullulans TaxID=5580 RepID=A0A4S9QQU4_AURPU|nr:hypothetical protein D6D24_10111 [Aureobasidium pullulans]THY84984.1 hypothetical protein D6C93_08362 [Aureobasidium pullulans]
MYNAPAAQASFQQQQPYQNGYAQPHYPAVAGYAQPPYQPAPTPVAYGAQPYQQPYAAPPQNGPPLKKQKGNPVITRYPPPPGYKQQPTYTAAPYTAPTYPTHQAPQPAYPQQGYQGYQAPPTTGYPPAATYPTQPVYDPSQAYQQPPYQPHQPPQPAQSYAVAAPVQPYAVPASAYPPQEHSGYYDVNGAYVAAPSAHSTPYMDASAYPPPISEDGYAASHTRQSSLDFGLDFDFEGEAGVPAEEVVPELSLGLIIWHPAIPTSKPLPSVFDDVEPTWTESVKATEDAHISVTSEFFPDDMSVDIRLSVRDTDEWEKVKDDLIFVEFGKTAVTVPVRTVIANRDRPDPVTDQLEPVTQDNVTALVSHPEALMQQAVAGAYEDQSDGDQAMDMSDDEDEPAKPVLQPVIQPLAHPLPRPVAHAAPPVKQVTILDTLEQALGPKSPRKNDRQSSRASARYSRSRSPEKRSRQGSQQPKAKPAPLPKDSAQENILAALGVEGSPKMVYPTPPPALGLPVPPTNRYVQFSGGITFYDLTYGSKKITPPGAFGPAGQRFAYGPQFPPPPPPRESRSPSFDPWRAHDPASPKSTTSQHTAVGSDFHPDDVMVDLDATPKAQAPVAPEKSGSGRKRTYEEVAAAEGRRRQDDDTPRAHRMRRSRQDVYSRYRR